MVGIHVPTHDYYLDPPALAGLEKTPMPYEVELHYDYGRYGGKQDKLARYDGDRLLAFTNAVGVTDWYEASPDLAGSLRTELFWAFAPADAQGLRGSGIDHYTREVLLVLGEHRNPRSRHQGLARSRWMRARLPKRGRITHAESPAASGTHPLLAAVPRARTEMAPGSPALT